MAVTTNVLVDVVDTVKVVVEIGTTVVEVVAPRHLQAELYPLAILLHAGNWGAFGL